MEDFKLVPGMRVVDALPILEGGFYNEYTVIEADDFKILMRSDISLGSNIQSYLHTDRGFNYVVPVVAPEKARAWIRPGMQYQQGYGSGTILEVRENRVLVTGGRWIPLSFMHWTMDWLPTAGCRGRCPPGDSTAVFSHVESGLDLLTVSALMSAPRNLIKAYSFEETRYHLTGYEFVPTPPRHPAVYVGVEIPHAGESWLVTKVDAQAGVFSAALLPSKALEVHNLDWTLTDPGWNPPDVSAAPDTKYDTEFRFG